MVESNVNVPTWKQKLAVELRRDTRKTVALGLLLVVAGVAAGRLLVKELTPSDARADFAAGDPVTEAPGTAASPSAAAPGLIGQSEPPARRSAIWYPRHLNREIARDIFLPNPDFFPPEEPPPAPEAKGTSGADARKQADAEAKAVAAQARALTLQSTVVSATPTAIINGRVLRAGEWINGFQVTRITSHTCTLEKKGITVVLEMKS